MSDSRITLVPHDTGHVPATDKQQNALRVFPQIAPQADDITLVLHPTIQFFDCGANFEKILCTHCGKDLAVEWWHEITGADYSASGGFALAAHQLPC